jgi:hypothetical protein
MARPKKLPTKVVRIPVQAIMNAKLRAKKLKMTLPDYLEWRLSK